MPSDEFALLLIQGGYGPVRFARIFPQRTSLSAAQMSASVATYLLRLVARRTTLSSEAAISPEP